MFSGGVAVITGAASGLGAGLARQAAALGMIVIAADVNLAGAQGVAAGIVASGGRAEAFACDVSRPENLEALAASPRHPGEGRGPQPRRQKRKPSNRANPLRN